MKCALMQVVLIEKHEKQVWNKNYSVVFLKQEALLMHSFDALLRYILAIS